MQANRRTSTTDNRFLYRTMILAAFALAILSSAGWLDSFADDRISETTNESIGIFFVSRGINAGISTLQSSEVGIGVASMQIGELLDPINDATERLSSVMVWAIGSLLLQRFTLELASTALFKWGFVAIACVTLLVLAIAEYQRAKNKPNAGLNRFRAVLIRIFVLAAMLRFVVPTFVAISLLLSDQFLQARIDEESGNLETMQEEISTDEQQGIFPNILDGIPSLSQITNLGERAAEFVQGLTELLVVVAIKNLVLPLVFLLIAVKGTLPIAGCLMRLSTPARQESNELTTA